MAAEETLRSDLAIREAFQASEDGDLALDEASDGDDDEELESESLSQGDGYGDEDFQPPDQLESHVHVEVFTTYI